MVRIQSYYIFIFPFPHTLKPYVYSFISSSDYEQWKQAIESTFALMN